MADIHIKKKNNNQPVWPWVLGILVIAGLIWAAVELFDTDAQREYGPVATDEPALQDEEGEADLMNEVEDFVGFVEERDAMEERGLDHEYTHDGLNKLADALDAMDNELDLDDLNVGEQTDRIRDNADYLQEDPESLTHADSIRSAFEVANELISQIQSRYFPNLEGEVNELRNQAQNLDPNQPALDQKNAIEQYFTRASEILRTMDIQSNGENGTRQQEVHDDDGATGTGNQQQN